MTPHRFPYRWTLAGTRFTGRSGTVFSCFSGGGGSSLGYQLAGFKVVGCCEIDPRMMRAYLANNKPAHAYRMPIQELARKARLPKALHSLDILDGSPPCTPFSMAGKRERDWGTARKFREGQAEQVIDTLFFDFIALARRLQPKVVVAENVTGLRMGAARAYYGRILDGFREAGYHVRAFTLDSSRMGVPQHRPRIFFIALRADLAAPLMEAVDLFTAQPRLDMVFSEPPIPFRQIREEGADGKPLGPKTRAWWDIVPPGDNFRNHHPQKRWFSSIKAGPDTVLPTLLAKGDYYDYMEPRRLSAREITLASSFPLDYDFAGVRPCYVCGMSVPPVMAAQVAARIRDQWLTPLSNISTQHIK
jgi:DNA (cytosine-5)-methyltransferase 1